MSKKIVIVAAALGIAAVAYGTLLTASNAQSPANETMEQKVVRLEKEVSDLRKEVARLKRYSNVITIPATNPQIGRAVPPSPGKPFGFNGQTYHYVPLSETSGGAKPTAPNAAVKINSLVPAPK